MQKQYYVYILTNAGKTVLYVGFTNNLPNRVERHGKGMGSAFTKKYRAAYLLYYEIYQDVHQAIARETEIKAWRRSKKEALIRSMNPRLDDLRSKLGILL